LLAFIFLAWPLPAQTDGGPMVDPALFAKLKEGQQVAVITLQDLNSASVDLFVSILDQTGEFQMAYFALGYPTVDAVHPDMPPLDVLSAILGQGENSRLNSRLISTRSSGLSSTTRIRKVFSIFLPHGPWDNAAAQCPPCFKLISLSPKPISPRPRLTLPADSAFRRKPAKTG